MIFNFSDKLEGIKEFLDVLSWKKIAQVSVFLAILLCAWASYESRESIYNFVKNSKLSNQSPTISISKITASDIQGIVDKSELIIGIQIIIVDFQRNTRSVAYTYTDDTGLRNIYDNFQKNNIFDFPLFTNDESNNKRLVELINGEFVCVQFHETMSAKILPAADQYIKTTCSTGIPPFYGKFSGVVSVYTKRTPSAEEVDQIRGLAKNISAIVYERDLR